VIQMPSKDFATAGGFIYLSGMGPQLAALGDISGQTRSVIERANTSSDS